MKSPAAGGGHWAEVAPERFTRWIDGFAARHGGIVAVTAHPDAAGPDTVTFTAADQAGAECHPPFPPLPGPPAADVLPLRSPVRTALAIAAHAAAGRTVGVLLVRLGGYAAGVFAGDPPELIAHKTGSRPVHGRSAAGGWSQQRFARRRGKQVSEALAAAAAAAVRVFGAAALDAVVLGGDRRAIGSLRGDPRLAPYLARAQDRFLTVPDPRLDVLRGTPRAFRAIRVRVTEIAVTKNCIAG